MRLSRYQTNMGYSGSHHLSVLVYQRHNNDIRSRPKNTTAILWRCSASAHRSVPGGSPLYAVGLQAISGCFRRQFTHLNILYPEWSRPDSKCAFVHFDQGKYFEMRADTLSLPSRQLPPVALTYFHFPSTSFVSLWRYPLASSRRQS
jgi:hypothetical protein